MGMYTYKATDSSGKLIKGVLDAADERGAVRRLQEMGYIPIRVFSGGGKAGGIFKDIQRSVLSAFRQVSSRDIMMFTQDLSTLLGAGLPVDKALAIQKEVTENEKLKEIIDNVLDSVKSGSYLSEALAKYPGIFSKLYVNMVKAGESGGVMGEVLMRLGLFLEDTVDLKDYIKSALVYPIFLVLVGGISIVILLTFVIPKFSIIFSDMGQSLPLSTVILLSFSNILRKGWFLFLGGGIVVIIWLRRYGRTEVGRVRFDRFKMAVPVIGKLIQSIEVSRFTRTLGTLQNSGVPILQALILAKDIVENRIMYRAMEKISERVKEGDRLSTSLREIPFFPALAVQMITIGEETGSLGEMLLRIAENYEKTVKTMVKRLISFLEPAMILAMGLIVGFIVISMLMAIFSINELPF
jgi:type II secretion system protein F